MRVEFLFLLNELKIKSDMCVRQHTLTQTHTHQLIQPAFETCNIIGLWANTQHVYPLNLDKRAYQRAVSLSIRIPLFALLSSIDSFQLFARTHFKIYTHIERERERENILVKSESILLVFSFIDAVGNVRKLASCQFIVRIPWPSVELWNELHEKPATYHHTTPRMCVYLFVCARNLPDNELLWLIWV